MARNKSDNGREASAVYPVTHYVSLLTDDDIYLLSEGSLVWHLLSSPLHTGLKRWVEDLNRLYRNQRALHEMDFDPAGFEWIDCTGSEKSILSLIRNGRSTEDALIIVCNFTPVPRFNYRVGAPRGGYWREILNSDSKEYGGSGHGNLGGVEASPISSHGRPYSLNLTLPPLGTLFFKHEEAQV